MDDPLVDGKLSLRALNRDDLDMLRHWRNDWSVRSVSREYRLLTDIDQERWYESLIKKPPEHLMFVIVAEYKPIGCCGLCYIDWKNRHAEVSIYIGDKESRGQGLGKRVLKMLEDYAFSELGLFKIWAEVYEFNKESNNLFEAAGFLKVATRPFQVFRNGIFYSSHFYERYWADSKILDFKAVEKMISDLKTMRPT